MADPPTPPSVTPPEIVTPTQDQLDKWNILEQVTASAGFHLEGVGTIGKVVGTVFGSIDESLKKAGISFKNINSLTDQTSRQFGGAITMVLGARSAFDNLSGSMNTDGLVTYMEQFRELGEILRAGPGTQMAANAIETVIGTMSKMGATSDQLKKAQNELGAGVMKTAAAFFTSADNIHKLQYSMMQATLSGHGMQDLFDSVGDDFEKLDDVTKSYTDTLNKATTALGGSKKAQENVALYMEQIQKMPGGLKILTETSKIAGQENDLLTETFKIAAISGRNEKEVLQDISKVLNEYKSALDKTNDAAGAAATLQARMATIAGGLRANIQDVRDALMGSVDAFKMFSMNGSSVSGMTTGMADAMENYVSSLVSVGVPASNAIEMFKNYTGVMKDMNLGQKSFLSTMSGGAGGLRGAFQIQDKIAKGDFDSLRSQVETTMKKMTGPILSRDDAMKSEAAASNYTRQIQLLQNGPLGGLAKSMPEAEALLKAMKEGTKLPTQIGGEKATNNKMQSAMDAGQKIQQDSYNELTKANASLNALVIQAGVANKKTARNILGTGNTGAYAGGVDGKGGGITPGRTGIGIPNNNALQQIAGIAMNLPRTVKEAWDSFKEVLGTGNKESIQKANDKMITAIKEQKAVWANLTPEQKAAMNTTSQAFSAVKPTTQAASSGIPTVTPATTTSVPRTAYATPTTAPRPGQRVPAPMQPPATAATSGGAASRAGQTGGMAVGPNGQAVPVTLAPGSTITVNLTGACPHCGRDVRHSLVDQGVSQGTNQG